MAIVFNAEWLLVLILIVLGEDFVVLKRNIQYENNKL